MEKLITMYGNSGMKIRAQFVIFYGSNCPLWFKNECAITWYAIYCLFYFLTDSCVAKLCMWLGHWV